VLSEEQIASHSSNFRPVSISPASLISVKPAALAWPGSTNQLSHSHGMSAMAIRSKGGAVRVDLPYAMPMSPQRSAASALAWDGELSAARSERELLRAFSVINALQACS